MLSQIFDVLRLEVFKIVLLTFFQISASNYWVKDVLITLVMKFNTSAALDGFQETFVIINQIILKNYLQLVSFYFISSLREFLWYILAKHLTIQFITVTLLIYLSLLLFIDWFSLTNHFQSTDVIIFPYSRCFNTKLFLI